jgi:hypothetical protein
VVLDHRTAERETRPHAVRLGRKQRLKDAIGGGRINAVQYPRASPAGTASVPAEYEGLERKHQSLKP